jgi:hypothetical protein
MTEVVEQMKESSFSSAMVLSQAGGAHFVSGFRRSEPYHLKHPADRRR